jgi:hypothetical protein
VPNYPNDSGSTEIGFDKDVMRYELVVPSTIENVTLRATSAISEAIVGVQLEQEIGYDELVPEEDGSFQIQLQPGEIIYATVYSKTPSGLSQHYSVRIQRRA